jgi:hypothetical protein
MAVFVLDQQKRPLMPSTSERARTPLACAPVHLLFPFCILLVDQTVNHFTLLYLALKIDPSSVTKGIAMCRIEDVADIDGVVEPVMHIQFLLEVLYRCKPLQAAHHATETVRSRRRSANQSSSLTRACGPCNSKKAARNQAISGATFGVPGVRRKTIQGAVARDCRQRHTLGAVPCAEENRASNNDRHRQAYEVERQPAGCHWARLALPDSPDQIWISSQLPDAQENGIWLSQWRHGRSECAYGQNEGLHQRDVGMTGNFKRHRRSYSCVRYFAQTLPHHAARRQVWLWQKNQHQLQKSKPTACPPSKSVGTAKRNAATSAMAAPVLAGLKADVSSSNI